LMTQPMYAKTGDAERFENNRLPS